MPKIPNSVDVTEVVKQIARDLIHTCNISKHTREEYVGEVWNGLILLAQKMFDSETVAYVKQSYDDWKFNTLPTNAPSPIRGRPMQPLRRNRVE